MFFEKLKAVCADRNTTPTAVAKAVGISPSNVTEWKRGKYPKVEVLLRISAHLGVEPGSLIPSVPSEGGETS